MATITGDQLKQLLNQTETQVTTARAALKAAQEKESAAHMETIRLEEELGDAETAEAALRTASMALFRQQPEKADTGTELASA